MPISSLPGNQGIGDFGKHTYRLIDAISKQHIRIWQILPLNPVGYGNSPYQPFSSYAGDEIYISVDTLADYGLLKQSSIRNYNKFSEKVDYDGVRAFKAPYLKKAYKTFLKMQDTFAQEYQLFCSTAPWLYPYAVFITLKKHNQMASWTQWPKEQREWIRNRRFSLKEDFLLDPQGNPSHIAGVPPDYFSDDGQRWGNPIYNWKQMKKDHYDFWMERLAWNQQQYDIIRLDHFRAFDTYWKIPASCPTAKDGEWIMGPSYEFFDEVFRRFPDIRLIAEDLGDLRRQVGKLRDHYNLMGMNVISFELQPKLLKKPRKEHIVLYTGTHDNDTLEGFYQLLTQNQRIALRRFFHNCGYDNRMFHELVIRYCLDSAADVVILPMSDILGLKSEGRLNTPGTIGSPNWEWKVKNLKEFYALLPKLGEWMQAGGRS